MSIIFVSGNIFIHYMNVYLIEPYNAHQKPPRKKHWMEIAEEEALYQRIAMETDARNQILQRAMYEQALQEHIALREASAIQNQQNLALLSQTAPPSSQQFQNGNTVCGNSGAGGVPPLIYFQNVAEVTEFSVSPITADGPLTVTFANLTPSPDDDTYLWDFGSGSLTSTLQNPAPVLYTQTGSYTIILTSISAVGNTSVASHSISASVPTVTAGFTLDTSSNIGYAVINFVNTTVDTSQTPFTIYKWIWGDNTTSSVGNLGEVTTKIYAQTGSITASLEATGSYGAKSKYTSSFVILAPTLTAGFTVTSASNIAGVASHTFTDSSSYVAGTGGYIVTGSWNFGDSTSSLYTYQSGAITHAYSNTGSFTASLGITESRYNIKSSAVKYITLVAPTLNVSIAGNVLTTGSAPISKSLVASHTYNGGGSVTGSWVFGDGSSAQAYSNGESFLHIYANTGSYTASVAITESNFGITSTATVYISASL